MIESDHQPNQNHTRHRSPTASGCGHHINQTPHSGTDTLCALLMLQCLIGYSHHSCTSTGRTVPFYLFSASTSERCRGWPCPPSSAYDHPRILNLTALWAIISPSIVFKLSMFIEIWPLQICNLQPYPTEPLSASKFTSSKLQQLYGWSCTTHYGLSSHQVSCSNSRCSSRYDRYKYVTYNFIRQCRCQHRFSQLLQSPIHLAQ